jgi:pyridoxal phosphate enzyme (YggS family)
VSATTSNITANLIRVCECIVRAAAVAGRRPEEVTLIAVSKTQPADVIRAAYEAGLREFGENRIQERERKLTELKDLDARWHMIGHLQSNKLPRAVNLFHSIDSVHSLELLQKLNSMNLPKGPVPVLLEVRMDSTPTKSGLEVEELGNVVEAAIAMPNVKLNGLMCVPPYFEDADQARPFFRRLHDLRDALARRFEIRLPTLSMGMSHDFEVAIEEGATEIRLGTALFGPRVQA